QDRQIDCHSREAPAARGKSGRSLSLKLTELLLEPVDIASGQIMGLLDDPVAGQPAAERPERRIEPVDLIRSQMRDLCKFDDAALVEQLGELRADAFQLDQV